MRSVASLPKIMGILNVTPDSFSDGGLHTTPVASGLAMLDAGADIVDIGGESTRPGAEPVSVAEEQRRILPTVAALARKGARISVDTRNADTMRVALEAGATIINDISALRHDPLSASFLATRSCDIVLMHMRGTPQTMARLTDYDDLLADIRAELATLIAHAQAAGIARARLTIDPGLGFAKTAAQSLAVLRHMSELSRLGLPILIGASRKGFLGQFGGQFGGQSGGQPDPRQRTPASIAAALFAASRGAAILRVHDVAETRQALTMWQALAG